MFFLPDRVYKVVVYSVNGEGKTDSDSQEIFINPGEWFRFVVQNIKDVLF